MKLEDKKCVNCINFFQTSYGNPNCKICDWSSYEKMDQNVFEWIKRNMGYNGVIVFNKHDICPGFKHFASKKLDNN